jgi:hypothetical protein
VDHDIVNARFKEINPPGQRRRPDGHLVRVRMEDHVFLFCCIVHERLTARDGTQFLVEWEDSYITQNMPARHIREFHQVQREARLIALIGNQKASARRCRKISEERGLRVKIVRECRRESLRLTYVCFAAHIFLYSCVAVAVYACLVLVGCKIVCRYPTTDGQHNL